MYMSFSKENLHFFRERIFGICFLWRFLEILLLQRLLEHLFFNVLWGLFFTQSLRFGFCEHMWNLFFAAWFFWNLLESPLGYFGNDLRNFVIPRITENSFWQKSLYMRRSSELSFTRVIWRSTLQGPLHVFLQRFLELLFFARAVGTVPNSANIDRNNSNLHIPQ